MKRFCGFLFLLGAIWTGWAQNNTLSPAEISDHFSQAKRLFAEANEARIDNEKAAAEMYLRSLLHYERIATDGGVRNGKLFYNIGNIHIRLGDVGRAILNYKRALRFIPNDPNLLQNLSYARSIRLDAIEPHGRTTIARILFFWHFDLSSQFRLSAFMVSFVLIWIFAALRSLLRRNGFVWAVAAFSAITLLFAGSLTWETIEPRRNPTGVVLEAEVTGRKGNSETYQPSFTEQLHAGAEFVLREDRGDWYRVELADGRETWIPAGSAGLVSEVM